MADRQPPVKLVLSEASSPGATQDPGPLQEPDLLSTESNAPSAVTIPSANATAPSSQGSRRLTPESPRPMTRAYALQLSSTDLSVSHVGGSVSLPALGGGNAPSRGTKRPRTVDEVIGDVGSVEQEHDGMLEDLERLAGEDTDNGDRTQALNEGEEVDARTDGEDVARCKRARRSGRLSASQNSGEGEVKTSGTLDTDLSQDSGLK